MSNSSWPEALQALTSDQLDTHSNTVAAAQTQSRNAAAGLTVSKRMNQCRENAGATGPDGMTKRHRSPVHVEFFGIELQLPDDRTSLYGEGFVNLEEIDVVGLPPGLL